MEHWFVVIAIPQLFDLRQLLADLFIRRTFLVVDLDELPTYDSLRVDHEGRWMRPAAAVRIEDAVTINHFMVFVFEERKVELSFETLAEHLAKFFRFLMIVGADRQDLNPILLLFGQKAFQLPELFETEGSPVAAIKDQHNRFLAAQVRKRDGFSIRILQAEVGRGLTDLDTIQFGGDESDAVLGPQLSKG